MIWVKRLILCAAVVLTVLPTLTLRAETPAAILWYTDLDKAREASKSENRHILLYVTSENCLHCRRMDHDTFANRDVVTEVEETFVPAIVNASAHPAWVSKLKVATYPTTFIITPDWKVVGSLSGYESPDKFRDWLTDEVAKVAAKKEAETKKR